MAGGRRSVRVRETSPNGRASYTVKSLPADERPRERLLKAGAESLSGVERRHYPNGDRPARSE